MNGVLIGRGKFGHTQRENMMWRLGQRLEWSAYKLRTTRGDWKSLEAGRRAWNRPSLRASRRNQPC